MKNRAVLHLVVTIAVLLITWEISINSFDIQYKVRNILGHYYLDQNKLTLETAPTEPKCSLSRACLPGQFAFKIKSGAANIVGPKICFEGKIIMSHVMNNVGPGLNIVVVNGENGVVKKFGYLNMKIGNKEDILAYLKEIEPGMIVLVASFDDVTVKMTDEMRELFVGMGSTLIKSAKYRDSWVFAGRAGAENSSDFEKLSINDEKTNIYEKWPEVVEVAGCFPRTLTDGQKPLTGPL